jgi:superfamily I DNA/RNA helicase
MELDHETDYDEVAAAVYAPYEERLKTLGAVDFDDLVCRIAHVLGSDTEARAYWQSRFHYLMVDEYQDTNRAQLEVVRQLAGRARTCASSATTTRRSTAGAAPRWPTSSASTCTSSGPDN